MQALTPAKSVTLNRKKACLKCGNSFFCGYGIGIGVWNKRKFCSPKCSSDARNGVKYPQMSIDRMNEKNPVWKGIHAGKQSIHGWIERKLGMPKYCEHCKTTKAKTYDWSNKDHKYSRRFTDWQRLCRSCHLKYDYKFNKRNI